MKAVNRPVDDYADDHVMLWMTLGVVSISAKLRAVLDRAPIDADDTRIVTDFDHLVLGLIAIGEVASGLAGDAPLTDTPLTDTPRDTAAPDTRSHDDERWLR